MNSLSDFSSQGSFCLCADVSEEGYLIRFVSQRFVNLFDFRSSECVGERCFNVVLAETRFWNTVMA
jgi:hypothetical protein